MCMLTHEAMDVLNGYKVQVIDGPQGSCCVCDITEVLRGGAE